MYEQIATAWGISVATATLLVTVISIWELVWKGIAMWYSAGEKQKVWFVCLLVFNTIGILPIIYLFMYKPWEKKNKGNKNKKKKTKK